MSARPPIKLTVSRARMYDVIRAPLITEKTTNGFGAQPGGLQGRR